MLRAPWQFWCRVAGVLVGLALFTAGAVSLFTIDNSAGSLFLVGVGLALVLVSLIGRRAHLESLEILGARISVQDVIESRLDMAALMSATDTDPSRGTDAREQARVLQEFLVAYGLYRHVRVTQRASDRRTAILDQLAARIESVGRKVQFDPVDVSSWFHNGDDALRVVALNLMLARDDNRDLLAVLTAIDRPRSPVEQYYALRLAHAMMPERDAMERDLLLDSARRARGRLRFQRDPHLMAISNSLLQQAQYPH